MICHELIYGNKISGGINFANRNIFDDKEREINEIE